MATRGFTITPTPQDVVTAVPLSRWRHVPDAESLSTEHLSYGQADAALADPDYAAWQSEGGRGRSVSRAGSGEYETVYLLAGDGTESICTMWAPDGDSRVSIVESRSGSGTPILS